MSDADEHGSSFESKSEAQRAWLLVFQLVLQKQCRFLIENAKLPADIECVVRDLWTLQLFTPSARILFDHHRHDFPPSPSTRSVHSFRSGPSRRDPLEHGYPSVNDEVRLSGYSQHGDSLDLPSSPPLDHRLEQTKRFRAQASSSDPPELPHGYPPSTPPIRLPSSPEDDSDAGPYGDFDRSEQRSDPAMALRGIVSRLLGSHRRHARSFSALASSVHEFSQSETPGVRSYQPSAVPDFSDPPRLIDSLAICYLACRLLRLPVRIADLHYWADSWDLVFCRADEGVPQDLRTKLDQRGRSALAIPALLPDKLQRAILDSQIAYQTRFHITFPAPDWPVVTLQYLGDLGLPIEVYSAVKSLRAFVLPQSTLAMPDDRRPRIEDMPECRIAGLLVIAVALLFPFSPLPDDDMDWDDTDDSSTFSDASHLPDADGHDNLCQSDPMTSNTGHPSPQDDDTVDYRAGLNLDESETTITGAIDTEPFFNWEEWLQDRAEYHRCRISKTGKLGMSRIRQITRPSAMAEVAPVEIDAYMKWYHHIYTTPRSQRKFRQRRRNLLTALMKTFTVAGSDQQSGSAHPFFSLREHQELITHGLKRLLDSCDCLHPITLGVSRGEGVDLPTRDASIRGIATETRQPLAEAVVSQERNSFPVNDHLSRRSHCRERGETADPAHTDVAHVKGGRSIPIARRSDRLAQPPTQVPVVESGSNMPSKAPGFSKWKDIRRPRLEARLATRERFRDGWQDEVPEQGGRSAESEEELLDDLDFEGEWVDQNEPPEVQPLGQDPRDATDPKELARRKGKVLSSAFIHEVARVSALSSETLAKAVTTMARDLEAKLGAESPSSSDPFLGEAWRVDDDGDVGPGSSQLDDMREAFRRLQTETSDLSEIEISTAHVNPRSPSNHSVESPIANYDTDEEDTLFQRVFENRRDSYASHGTMAGSTHPGSRKRSTSRRDPIFTQSSRIDSEPRLDIPNDPTMLMDLDGPDLGRGEHVESGMGDHDEAQFSQGVEPTLNHPWWRGWHDAETGQHDNAMIDKKDEGEPFRDVGSDIRSDLEKGRAWREVQDKYRDFYKPG
ncbi:hypothetical protein P152DRAFT_517760 [Eremomyces bilateralis CBS 781.70]|uniref:Uncharacterized protein n=1 Tax=Eremomyces bilateralis CBS 781.70 TaxID=1392243 RepID=A0A6G1FQP4_9PEZI|nr:uncharacterized protein P152DRAFT_517760 [Eremomyces bilateralis CBS 781.70]KAF1808155.1 hypothetical protein P152DRAFT_517760 [Eremomyces bilateralis CBS 781.70]